MKETLASLEQAAQIVYKHMAPTPEYVWPQLCELTGTRVWVKHENHTPTGAFKARGGFTFIDWLRNSHPEVKGIVSATRGNHGQSQSLAATSVGLSARIVAPRGNSVEKNRAMRGFGAQLVEYGDDFDEARGEAERIAVDEGLFMVPSFHRALVSGVASYALELFRTAPDLHTVYVPVGCGSGICGVIQARDALNLKTRVVGVVSSEAQAVKLSFDSGRITETEHARTFADGVAVRVVVPEAFAIYSGGADRILAVSEREIAEAIQVYYEMTHNLAEGAGAATLAALLREREQMQGKEVAVILTGANIDRALFQQILAGEVPEV